MCDVALIRPRPLDLPAEQSLTKPYHGFRYLDRDHADALGGTGLRRRERLAG